MDYHSDGVPIVKVKSSNQWISSPTTQDIDHNQIEEDFIHENEQNARIKAEKEARLKALYEAKNKIKQESKNHLESSQKLNNLPSNDTNPEEEYEARFNAEQERRRKSQDFFDYEVSLLESEQKARIIHEEEIRCKAKFEAKIKSEHENKNQEE